MRGRGLDIAIGAALAAQLLAALILVPTATGDVSTPWGDPLGGLCWVREWLGFDCPFCGMARSFVAAVHGQLGRAFELHPGGPLLAAAMLVGLIAIGRSALARSQPVLTRRRWLAGAQVVVAACVVLGAGRAFW